MYEGANSAWADIRTYFHLFIFSHLSTFSCSSFFDSRYFFRFDSLAHCEKHFRESQKSIIGRESDECRSRN